MGNRFLFLFTLLVPACAWAQGPIFRPDVPVTHGGQPLQMPWAGGLNAPQFSPIDINQDGLMDIFVLDRIGDTKLFLLNTGTAENPVYTPTRQYDGLYPFPLLHDWALLRDYNCDGKADIFAYTSAGFAVYRNTSGTDGPSFVLSDDMVGSNYVPTISPNLYVSNVDLPGIADIDGDGDLDLLTFSIWGNVLEYHKNLSMELYGHCDSLVYEVRSRCWGDFQVAISSNQITLDMACPFNVPNPEAPAPHPDPGTGQPERAHSGSTTLPLDLNGDGLTDLILGDFETPFITALINGGNSGHAHMSSADSAFPASNPVALEQFLGCFHLDIDGDGRRDLVVAPNSPSSSADTKGIWYYRNTGTDAAPDFQFMQDDLFQGQMLDFGSGARPVLFDHNGDGLMDLVVANEGYFQPDGTYKGTLALLQNNGTATSPSFELVTTDYAGLGALGLGAGLHPAFGDVDGDGRPDMILGDLAGNLRLFKNVGTGPVAQFQQVGGLLTDDGGGVIDVGANATPQLFDLDGDGTLELVVGERSGNLNLYRNTGSPTAPQWHLETENLGAVRVNEYWNNTGYSVPFLYRDVDGQAVLVAGSESGGLHRYTNINGNISGAWTLADSLWHGLRDGARTAGVLHDFLGTGELALVVGNYRGGLSFWATDELAGPGTGIGQAASIPFTLWPNPASTTVELRWHAPLHGSLNYKVMDASGKAVRIGTTGGATAHIGLQDLAPGLYVVQLATATGQWCRRLAIAY